MVLIFLVEGTVEVWLLVVLTRAVFLRILDVVVVVLVEACVHVGVFDLSWDLGSTETENGSVEKFLKAFKT